MPKFGKRSKERLSTCDKKLQKVFNEVIKHVDCSILEGHRNEERQNELYRQGKSRLKYPCGKHNSSPSKAVDAVPYPISWSDIERMRAFAFFVKGIAACMGIKLRLGADWDGDFTNKDQTFHDLPHYELVD